MKHALVLATLVQGSLLVFPASAKDLDAPGVERLDEAPRPGDGIVGEWLTEKKDGKVRFARQKDGTYWGILTWSADATEKDGSPRKDAKNPDAKMRDRSIIGIVLVWDLRFKDGSYEGGHVYDPDSGKTYNLEAKVQSDGRLKIRGYAGLSLLGATEIWTRP